jgi:hypothetical protein
MLTSPGPILMLRFLPLPQKVIALSEPGPALPPSLEQEVDEIWQAERAWRGRALFDGPLFSVEEISPYTVAGRFVEFRRFLAQERRPELFSELRIQPLAVTGLLQNAEGLFFGYRSSAVALQPDCWELIPSGGVDRTTLTESGQIHPAGQILTELQEEVGIKAAAVVSPRLLCFSEDPLHHNFELAWELKTQLDSAAILGAHAALAHREHAEITFVRWADLESFLAHGPDAVTHRSRHLLGHLSLPKSTCNFAL